MESARSSCPNATAPLPNPMRLAPPDADPGRRDGDVGEVAELLAAGFLRLMPEQDAAGWAGDDGGESDRRLPAAARSLRPDASTVLPASGVTIALTSCRLPVGDGEER